jgi:hypothetical protein
MGTRLSSKGDGGYSHPQLDDDVREPPTMLLKRALAAVIVCLTLPYALSPIYRFPAPQPFAGAQFWNPYAGVRGTWRRANFHAHGRAWGGVTNGAQDDADVAAAYRAHGYDVVGVSDYQHIADPSLQTIPVYEHGFNVGKHHQLAIGARYVEWFDFPLWQGTNQKQYIINRVRPSAALISINHPSRLHSYTVDDVTQLTGYDLIELANGRVTTEDRWDAALSSGHAIWAIGGDDTHDVTDPMRMAVAWNMVGAATASSADVIDALRAGRSYTVVRTSDTETTGGLTLAEVRVDQGVLTVGCDGPPATFVFIGDNGAVRKTATNVMSASYVFAPGDTYVRTVVHGAKTDLFVNPVLRTDGGPPRGRVAVVDGLWTAVARAAIITACAVVAWLLVF